MLLTLPEVSAYLHLHRNTIYKLVKRKELPAVRLGHQWRFHREWLETWLKRGANAPIDHL